MRLCLIILMVATIPAFAASPLFAGSMETTVRPDPKTGRLVRSVVVTPRVVSSATPRSAPAAQNSESIAEIIDAVAAQQGVEAPLVHSVIRAESNYNPNAVSPKGAQGVMQLIPATARRFGVSDSFDPRENIEGGVRYLRFLLDYYRGDYPKAIAAYNAGEAAVDKFNGIPPYGETRNYVWQVAKNLKAAREKQAKTPAKAPPVETASLNPASLSKETPRRVETSVGPDGRVYYRTP